jgi:hypothetical protein
VWLGNYQLLWSRQGQGVYEVYVYEAYRQW